MHELIFLAWSTEIKLLKPMHTQLMNWISAEHKFGYGNPVVEVDYKKYSYISGRFCGIDLASVGAQSNT